MTWIRSSHSWNGDCVEIEGRNIGMWKTASRSYANGDCVAVWEKSQRSGAGNCVEWSSPSASESGNCVQRTVRSKSSHTNANGACVETCLCGVTDCGLIHLQDSKDPSGDGLPGVRLDYAEADWDGGRIVQFLPVSRAVVQASENGKRALAVAAGRGHDADARWYMVCPTARLAAALWFDQGEADAFRAGVADGEFTLVTA